MSLHCPVCGSTRNQLMFERTHVPILMHRQYRSAHDAKAAGLGPLEMHGCLHCGFVWNAAFEPDLIEYSSSYENNQTHSTAFSAHLSEMVANILAAAPTSIDYLEIGCGQGDFMDMLLRAAPDRFRNAEGFDTVWRGTSDRLPSGARIHRSYFDGEAAKELVWVPNIVVTRHTIEHVPNPCVFLSSIRSALGSASRAKIFVETPNVQWIIDNSAVQDFFYEHCSIFTPSSLTIALEKSGFGAVKVRSVFGDQYLWAEAIATNADDRTAKDSGFEIPSLSGIRENFINKWKSVLNRSDGPIAIWGAGAKGITFALLLDKDATRFDHVIDINPKKQDFYLPASGLPVLSPEKAAKRSPKTIFVMNPVTCTPDCPRL